MLSYPACHVKAVHKLYLNSRTWSSNDVIVILKWRHQNMSNLSLFGNFCEILKHKMQYLMVSKKKESKSVPRNHGLSSLGKPRDAKR